MAKKFPQQRTKISSFFSKATKDSSAVPANTAPSESQSRTSPQGQTPTQPKQPEERLLVSNRADRVYGNARKQEHASDRQVDQQEASSAITDRREEFLAFLSQTSTQKVFSTDRNTSPSVSITRNATATDVTREFLEDEVEIEHEEKLDRLRRLISITTKIHSSLSNLKQTNQQGMAVSKSAVTDTIYIPFGPVSRTNGAVLEHECECDGDGIPLAIQPFAPLPEYFCPFKAAGMTCTTKTVSFKNYRGLSAHCNQKHRDQTITSVEEDPFEDGTSKIPCPKGCGGVFSSYHAANDHAKMPQRCSRPDDVFYPRKCPWANVDGVLCSQILDVRHAGSHVTVHCNDPRGPFQCHICNSFFADLYQLARHVSSCTTKEKEARYCQQMRLTLEDEGEDSVIFVARSSAGQPKAWLAGAEFIHQGIRKFAQARHEIFQSDLNVKSATTFFHAHTHCQTRFIPSGRHSTAFQEPNTYKRERLTYAFKFTAAIENDLRALAMAKPQRKPFIVSVGLDGFACHAPMIAPFLRRNPDFIWVIRETELLCGMDVQYFPRSESGIYYGIFESSDILTSIESDVAVSKAVANLLDAWRIIQSSKDLRPGRRIGRNG